MQFIRLWTHPKALRAIKAHYMNDYVDSFDNEDEAKETIQQVDYVHRQAGFVLRSLNSNSEFVI